MYTPVIFRVFELSLKSWRNWKIDFFSRARIEKRTSDPWFSAKFMPSKKKFFLLRKIRPKKFFFCMGRLRSTWFHDFRFSTRFGGRNCFLWNHERLSNYTTRKITVFSSNCAIFFEFRQKMGSLAHFEIRVFFCMGRLRSTWFHDFRFSTRFWGTLCFL